MCKKIWNEHKGVIIINGIILIIWVLIYFGIKSILNGMSATDLAAYQSVISNLVAMGGVITAACCSVWSIFSSTKDIRDATEQLTTNANNSLIQAKKSDLQAFELARTTMALDMIEKMTISLKKEISLGLTPSLGVSNINLRRYLDTAVLYLNKLKVLFPNCDLVNLPSVQEISNIDVSVKVHGFPAPDSLNQIFNKLDTITDVLDQELTESIGQKIEGFEQISFN